MFTECMPEATSVKSLTILRAKAGSPIVGMIAGLPVRCLTHYFRKKTVPCVMSSHRECPLCTKGLSKRYYAYYPLQSGKGSLAVIELTASSEAALVDFLKNQPPMSLPVLTVKRQAGRKNNPLIVNVDFKHCSHEEMAAFGSKTVDKDIVKRTLCRLWSMPEWSPGMNEDEYGNLAASYLTELVNERV